MRIYSFWGCITAIIPCHSTTSRAKSPIGTLLLGPHRAVCKSRFVAVALSIL